MLPNQKAKKISESFQRYKKMKPLVKLKRKGRPTYCMPFHQARDYIRKQALSSSGEYKKWWQIHQPSRIPKRPDRTYHKDFISWNDFLGINNSFYDDKIVLVSFEDARNFARKLNLKGVQYWNDFCRSGKKPRNIPRRPDIVYGKKGLWLSWKDFLGYSLEDKLVESKNKRSILAIIKYNETPSNVVTIHTLTEENYNKLKEEVNFYGGKIIANYVVQIFGVWKEELKKYSQPYGQIGSNQYMITDAMSLFEFLHNNYAKYE